jgi:diguanylate cyclase (GGDEF)-like protein/PAS domain S-box-containing protein
MTRIPDGLPLDDLRRRAEEVLNGDPLEMVGLSVPDLQFIIHELQVHQVELQLQNEELQRLQFELEISRDNYSNLYDFAPVSYCTLDLTGVIQKANQMCSEMIGVKKEILIGQPLARFVHQDDQDIFYLHHRQALKNRKKQVREIRIVATDGKVHHVQIQSVVSGGEGDRIRVILSDITERKEIEQTVQESKAKLAQRLRELNALHQAVGALLSTLDTDTLLLRSLESVLQAIPTAKMGVIYLIPAVPRPLRLSKLALSADANQENLTFSNRNRYVLKVLTTKQRLLIPEIKIQSGKDPAKTSKGLKTRSAMIVPLIAEEQTYGAISLESHVKGSFSETEMDLLENFAATATAAIRNARLHEQLKKTAITDFLTQVYNRQGFFEIGQHEFHRFLRSTHPLSLIALDIDDFKAINDTFGHAAGDQVLISLGQVLASQLRKVDVLARHGGDEFLVLLPETDVLTALKIAERLNQAIAGTLNQIGDQWIHITITQGMVQATKAMPDLNHLMKLADDVLYQAKAAGRNQIRASKTV